MEGEQRSPEDIEREIAATRGDIEGTVEEIGERLAPRRLAHEAVGYARHSAARGASRAWSRASDSMRDNAIPLALIGGGVAWWLASRSRQERYDYERPWGDAGYDEYRSMSGRAGQPMGTAEGARQLGERAMERGSELGARTQERVQRGLHDGVERTQRRVQSIRDEQPLLLGLASLALGAIAGGLLPSTRREDEMLGDTRDQVVQRAAEAGREKVEQVRRTTEEAAQRAGDGGQPSGSPTPEI